MQQLPFDSGAPPCVTVLMSVYNGEKYLSVAIDSILAQTYSDFEFLIIDDASSDGSLEIIKSYIDPRIKLIANPERMGLAANLNRGIQLAGGEYIARMDADDISMPQRLEKQVAFMNANPDIAASGTYVIDMNETGRDLKIRKTLQGRSLMRWAWMPSPMIHPTVILRKNVVEKFGYDSSMEPAEDYGLWLRMACAGERLDNLGEVLLRYRVHEQSVTSSKRTTQLLTTYSIFKSAYPELILSFEEFKSIISQEFRMSPLRRYRHIQRLTRSRLISFDLAKNTIWYLAIWAKQRIKKVVVEQFANL